MKKVKTMNGRVKKDIKKNVKKVKYDYKDFCIRKAVRTRDDHSICINLPKKYSRKLNWIGGQNMVKIRIVGEKIVINKITR